jgi:hypothetical protein
MKAQEIRITDTKTDRLGLRKGRRYISHFGWIVL